MKKLAAHIRQSEWFTTPPESDHPGIRVVAEIAPSETYGGLVISVIAEDGESWIESYGHGQFVETA
jgi:hypothetical protein